MWMYIAPGLAVGLIGLPLLLSYGAEARAARRQPAPPAPDDAGLGAPFWPLALALPSLAEAEAAVTATPHDAATLARRGAVLLHLGRYDDASADFHAARVRDERCAAAPFGLACIAAARGWPQIAVAYLLEARAIEPTAAALAASEPLLAALAAPALGQRQRAA